MSTTTTNYSLVKPDYTDIADIAVLNGNSDIIDSTMKTLADGVSTNASDIDSLESTTTSLSSNKQDKTDASLETTAQTVVGAINELNTGLTAFQGSIATAAYTATSLSDMETWLLARCQEMENYKVRIFYILPTFTSSSFFGGAPQVAIAIRRSEGIYRVAFPNICGDAYYYSSEWHYTKATMSTVTP